MSRPDTPWGLDSLAGEQFSVSEAIGGVRGVVESVVPSAVFLVVFAFTHDLRLSVLWAVGSAALLVLARLTTRGPFTQSISGLVGVAFCAFVAQRTGDAKNYYVPGFFQNLGFIALYGISLLPLPSLRIGGQRQPRGPYPLLGLVVGALMNEGLRWRTVPARARAYWLATWCWIALFTLRLVVQVPLYLLDSVNALGISRIAMGVPLFALAAWFSWLLIRPTNGLVERVHPVPEVDDAD